MHQRVVPGLPPDQRQVVGEAPEQVAAAPRVEDQLLDEEGVAPVDEDLAEDAHQQAREPPGDAPRAQLLERRPPLRAEQQRHHLPVVGGGVVEADLAQVRRLHGAGMLSPPAPDVKRGCTPSKGVEPRREMAYLHFRNGNGVPACTRLGQRKERSCCRETSWSPWCGRPSFAHPDRGGDGGPAGARSARRTCRRWRSLRSPQVRHPPRGPGGAGVPRTSGPPARKSTAPSAGWAPARTPPRRGGPVRRADRRGQLRLRGRVRPDRRARERARGHLRVLRLPLRRGRLRAEPVPAAGTALPTAAGAPSPRTGAGRWATSWPPSSISASRSSSPTRRHEPASPAAPPRSGGAPAP